MLYSNFGAKIAIILEITKKIANFRAKCCTIFEI
jgi:hypothetical protein